MKPHVVVVIYLLCCSPSFSQQPPIIDSLKALIAKAKPDTTKVNLLDDLCWEYLYYDPEKAIPYANEGLLLARSTGFRIGEGRLQNTLGSAFSNLMNFPEALVHLEEALKITEEIGNVSGTAACLTNIGNVYLHTSYYETAIRYYIKSIKILEKLNKRESLPAAYINLAAAYKSQNDYTGVRMYASKSLKLAEEVGDEAAMMDAKIHLGIVHYQKKEYDTALNYYQEAAILADRINDSFGKAMCHHNTAIVYKAMNRTTEALQHFEAQLRIAEKINSANDKVYAHTGMGQTHLQLGNYNTAKTFLLHALKLSKEVGTREESKEIYASLSELYERQQEFAKAIEYHKLYVQLKDSLLDEAKARQINELNIAYETETKENEIKILRQDNELQSLAIEKERLVRNFWITGAALLLVLALLLYVNSRQRAKANSLLISQKQELQEANAVKSKLFSVISHDLRSPLTSMHGLLQIMKNNDDVDEGALKEFVKHANAVTSNAVNLLDNLLYWSASQMKRAIPKYSAVNLSEVVQEIQELIEPLLQTKHIHFINAVNTSHTAYADASDVNLVLRNLVSNAIKFTPAGGRITVSSREKEDGTTEISVIDTGVGISESVRLKLFTHEQSTLKGTDNEKGTGLGLILCKEFVERNGGKIWVGPETGQGCIFCFTLRRHPAENPD